MTTFERDANADLNGAVTMIKNAQENGRTPEDVLGVCMGALALIAEESAIPTDSLAKALDELRQIVRNKSGKTAGVTTKGGEC